MTLDFQENPQQLEALRAFRMIFRAVRHHYQLVEKHAGISGAHTWALSLLVDRPGMTVSGLAESMAVHQSTASNLIDKLSRLGLVERVKDEHDLRVTYLHATPAAKQRLDGISGPVTGVLPAAISHISPEKLQQLNQGLAELLSKMTEVESDAGQIPLAEILADD